MKFRGKITEIVCLQHFARVINTISKIAKQCVLRITVDKMYFIMSDRVTNGGVGVWCELLQTHFFNEYSMEGVSVEFNEIFLEVPPENMMRVLKVSPNAKSVKIKLTKKVVPCLTFEVELPSLVANARLVVHDIPVNVIPKRLWDDYQEPEMPDFDVSLYLPPLKLLRSVVDQMKNLSAYVTVAANLNGQMTLKVETEIVTVTTHFHDLEMSPWKKDENLAQSQNVEKKDAFVATKLDIRRFAHFLYGQQVNPNRVLCNIVRGRMVQFLLLHDDVSLQYFIPSVD